VAKVEKEIEVAVPLTTAYNQWTQFEEFPQFMEGVEEVRQLDDRRLHWRASVGGRDQEWEAQIDHQLPDEIISWRSTSGAPNAGTVRFAPLENGRTRVCLEVEYEPEGFLETVGDAFGFMSRRVSGDLDRFKEFIENRGVATGGFRETIRSS
jgi:uncharacterized membrane protein